MVFTRAAALVVLALALGGCDKVASPTATQPGSSGAATASAEPTFDLTESPSASAAPSFTPAPPGHIALDAVEATIATQYAALPSGSAATVTCDGDRVVPSTPGNTITCHFTDAGGRTGVITVSITTAGGGYVWQVGVPEPSPTA